MAITRVIDGCFSIFLSVRSQESLMYLGFENQLRLQPRRRRAFIKGLLQLD